MSRLFRLSARAIGGLKMTRADAVRCPPTSSNLLPVMEAQTSANLQDLPTEVLEMIGLHLPYPALRVLRSICSRFRQVLDQIYQSLILSSPPGPGELRIFFRIILRDRRGDWWQYCENCQLLHPQSHLSQACSCDAGDVVCRLRVHHSYSRCSGRQWKHLRAIALPSWWQTCWTCIPSSAIWVCPHKVMTRNEIMAVSSLASVAYKDRLNISPNLVTILAKAVKRRIQNQVCERCGSRCQVTFHYHPRRVTSYADALQRGELKCSAVSLGYLHYLLVQTLSFSQWPSSEEIENMLNSKYTEGRIIAILARDNFQICAHMHFSSPPLRPYLEGASWRNETRREQGSIWYLHRLTGKFGRVWDEIPMMRCHRWEDGCQTELGLSIVTSRLRTTARLLKRSPSSITESFELGARLQVHTRRLVAGSSVHHRRHYALPDWMLEQNQENAVFRGYGDLDCGWKE